MSHLRLHLSHVFNQIYETSHDASIDVWIKVAEQCILIPVDLVNKGGKLQVQEMGVVTSKRKEYIRYSSSERSARCNKW